MSEILEHYRAWFADSATYPIAMCWAVVSPVRVPVTVEEVAVRLGGDPADLDVLELTEAYEVRPSRGFVLHLDQVGSRVTVFENNGFQCGRPEVLRNLSAHAEVVSAYWTVNLDSALSYATNGELLTVLEGLEPSRRSGTRVDALDSYLADLHEALADPAIDFRAGLLAVIEHCSGVRLDPEWFRHPHEAIIAPPIG